MRSHIGTPVFVNWTETHFSCVDGRFRSGIVATAGGDAAEFLLALNTARRSGVLMSPHLVAGLFRGYMGYMEPLRKFYMHTDEHAFNYVRTQLGLEEEFDPLYAPDHLKDPLLTYLTRWEGVGCGHLRLIMRYPTASETPIELSRWFMQAFFEYAWNEDAVRSKANKKLLYTVLTGEHAEQGVLEVRTHGCEGLVASVPSESKDGAFFVHHQEATNLIRKDLAHYFVSRVGKLMPNVTEVMFARRMAELGERQLKTTLAALANGLPLFTIKIDGDELTVWHALMGLSMSSLLALIIAVVIAYFLLNDKHEPALEVQLLVHDITLGTNRVIKVLATFLMGFGGVIFTVVLATTGADLTVPFVLTYVVACVSYASVLRFSIVSHMRCVAWEHSSVKAGYQAAIFCAFVVALVNSAPLLISLALIVYEYEGTAACVTGFGFAVICVGLLIRIGGGIFAKAAQKSHEFYHRKMDELEAIRSHQRDIIRAKRVPTPHRALNVLASPGPSLNGQLDDSSLYSSSAASEASESEPSDLQSPRAIDGVDPAAGRVRSMSDDRLPSPDPSPVLPHHEAAVNGVIKIADPVSAPPARVAITFTAAALPDAGISAAATTADDGQPAQQQQPAEAAPNGEHAADLSPASPGQQRSKRKPSVQVRSPEEQMEALRKACSLLDVIGKSVDGVMGEAAETMTTCTCVYGL